MKTSRNIDSTHLKRNLDGFLICTWSKILCINSQRGSKAYDRPSQVRVNNTKERSISMIIEATGYSFIYIAEPSHINPIVLLGYITLNDHL